MIIPNKNDRLLLDAVLNNEFKEAKLLLNIGANPNCLFDQEGGISPFHIAVGVGNLQLTKLFLKSEANVNLRCSNLGWTPMHVCAYWNKPDSLELLLNQKNADPFRKCNNNKTVLETAISNNSNDAITVLENYYHTRKKHRETPIDNRTINLDKAASAESLLSVSDISEISVFNQQNPDDFSFIVTSTFNENDDSNTAKLENQHDYVNMNIQLDKTIVVSPKKPPRTYEDSADCYPSKRASRKDNNSNSAQNKNRFQSPPNHPPFYSELLLKQQQPKSETKSIETQTTSNCVVIKKRDLFKEAEEETNQGNVVSSIKKWLINKLTSPLQNRIETHDFQAELQNNKIQRNVRQPRASSASGPVNHQSTIRYNRERSYNRNNNNHKKDYAPIAPHVKKKSNEDSFVDLKDIISDHIGTDFFNNVLGKSDSVQSFTKIINKPKNIANIAKYQKNKNSLFSPKKQPTAAALKNKYYYTKNKQISPECTTLTPTTMTSLVDDTYEDSANRDITLITLDRSADSFVTDDFNTTTTDRKSTSTRINMPNEVNLQTSFEEIFDISHKFQQCTIKCDKPKQQLIKKTPLKKQPTTNQIGYSSELILQLENKLNLTTTSDIMVSNMFECFGDSPTNTKQSDWREGHIKSAFNYVLIDPRLSRNLPSRAKKGMQQSEVLKTFVDSIFYIGKGSRARPYAHLYDTVKLWKTNNSDNEKLPKKSKKINKIIDIWNDGYGVVSLHIFQSVIPCEAYTREAAMIDAIGMHNLTNMKKGNYYGSAKNWKTEYQCKLGAILLKKACAIFLAEGERQIKPEDI